MPRVLLTPDLVTGKFPSVPVVITETAADATNFESFRLNGREILIARNTHATDAKTITINSVANPTTNRTGDITGYSIPAGVSVMVGPLAPEGWRQTDLTLHFQGESADIVFQVIQVAG